MHHIDGLSIKVQNFKSFRELQGFDTIRPINVIIGKNNSGKSALLDLIEFMIHPASIEEKGFLARDGKGLTRSAPEVQLSMKVTRGWLDHYFPDGEANNAQAKNDLVAACDGARAAATVTQNGSDIQWQLVDARGVRDRLQRAMNLLNGFVKNPFKNHFFRRIFADRDIRPEKTDGSMELGADGTHATSIVERFLHGKGMKREIVEEMLLDAMNDILQPDCSFRRIFVVETITGWEINLEDRSKRYVPLSQMGSGVKTVLLTLLNTTVLPGYFHSIPPWRWVFAFEELENNLHPAILRRLLRHLCDFVLASKGSLFLTTHSSAVVDLLSGESNAQILHVVRDNDVSAVSCVDCRGRAVQAVRDIGVKTSDVLLTNVVVWVEGPSDRTFFNRWVEIWSDGRLRENVDYQCVFFGGSLGTYYCFDQSEPCFDDVEDLIQALRINHNAVVLVDSDIKQTGGSLKSHVERIRNEASASGAYVWITAGREAENYIPNEILRSTFGGSIPDLEDPFASVFDHVAKHADVLSWEKRKSVYAQRIAKQLDRDSLHSVLDLEGRLRDVCRKIEEWNS